jgi:hypothetical protein
MTDDIMEKIERDLERVIAKKSRERKERRSKMTSEELAADDAREAEARAKRNWESRGTDALRKALGDKPYRFDLESNGHNVSMIEHELGISWWQKKYRPEEPLGMSLFNLEWEICNSDQENALKLAAVITDRTPLEEPIKFGKTSSECTYCGSKDWYTDGLKVWNSEPCPYPDGIPVQVELEVPSGYLIVGNDFRDKFHPEKDDHYVNVQYEIARCIKDYAEEGKMLHFFVGNSCPGMYEMEDGSYVIANALLDEDENPVLPGAKSTDAVASVITDLWWVCIVDKDEADKRGLEYQTGHWVENDPVPVEPGTYILTYYGCLKNFDRDSDRREVNPEPVFYAKLERKT